MQIRIKTNGYQLAKAWRLKAERLPEVAQRGAVEIAAEADGLKRAYLSPKMAPYIKITSSSSKKGRVLAATVVAPEGKFVYWWIHGTRAHDIYPRIKMALRFPDADGTMILRAHVNHPGQPSHEAQWARFLADLNTFARLTWTESIRQLLEE